MLTRLAIGLTLVSLATAPGVASARGKGGKRAAKLLKKGIAELNKGRFDTALDLLKKSHKLSDAPETHYHIGRAHVGLEQCPEAMAAFEAYVEAEPMGRFADDADAASEQCKAVAAVVESGEQDSADDFGDDDNFGDDDDFGDGEWGDFDEPEAAAGPWYTTPWFWSTVGGVLALGAGAAALSL